MINLALINNVADLEFGLQKQMFEKTGGVLYSIKGYLARGDKVEGVHSAQYQGDFTEASARLVPKLLNKFAVVVTVAEVWISRADQRQLGQGNNRQEAVAIQIHTKDAYWIMRCPISRHPDVLGRGELEMPTMVTGRGVDGGLTARDAARMRAEVGNVLTSPHPDSLWKSTLAFIFSRIVGELRDISPATDALYEHDVPTESLDFATRLLERMLLTKTYDLGEVAGLETFIVLGLNIEIGATEDGDGMLSSKAATSTLTDLLAKVFQEDGLPLQTDPDATLAIVGDFVPLSCAASILNLGLGWFAAHQKSTAKPDAIRTWFENKMDADEAEQASNPFVDALMITLPVLVKVPTTRVEHSNTIEPHVLPKALEDVIAKVNECAQGVVAEFRLTFDGTAEFRGCHPLYDALRAKHLARMSGMVETLVAHAVDLSEERGPACKASELKAVVGSVCLAKPIQHDSVDFSLWDHDSLLAPMTLQRLPYWSLKEYEDHVVSALSLAGVGDIEASSMVRKEQIRPVGAMGEPMFLGPDGSWFSPISVTIPEAIGVLQVANWDFIKSEDSQDPLTSTLPFPQMLQRFGIVAMMSRRFAPDSYRVIKEALSVPGASPDTAWALAGQNHPRLGRLLSKSPTLARPSDAITLSLQMHWTRSPTIKVRPTLTERLRLTDISEKLPAYLVGVPFPLCYIHLGFSEPVAEIRVSNSEGDGVYVPSGVFVSQKQQDGVREIGLWFVWQVAEVPHECHLSLVTLKIADETSTVAQCVDAALQDETENPDLHGAIRQAVEEVVKLLFYMSSKESRQTAVNERSQALKGLGKKTSEQQQRHLTKARALYDHILIGPETGLGFANAEGVRPRVGKVFVRRGHLHGYWTGVGRSIYVAHFLDPILVNKHLLGAGDEPPSPKDYLLH